MVVEFYHMHFFAFIEMSNSSSYILIYVVKYIVFLKIKSILHLWNKYSLVIILIYDWIQFADIFVFMRKTCL